jgi:signal peptidase
LTGLLIGISQITVLIFLSLFTGFAKSPYQFTPLIITLNLTYFVPALLAFELSRTYFIISCTKKKVILGIGLIGLFYTFIRFPSASLLTIGTPLEALKFLASDFLPTLAQSIVATLLALLGGPVASIAYLGSLDAVQWLSPILPNPGWSAQALIGTLVPTVGLVAIIQTANPFVLVRKGIMGKSEARRRMHPKKSFPLAWIGISLVSIILLWSSAGLLGFTPSVVASGSMRPAFDVGDIAITVQTSASEIRQGDVLRYLRNSEFIVHRVVEVHNVNGAIFFITKGDANNVPDDPVRQDAVVGKVLYVIPKLGWVSIYLKIFFAETYEFLSTNLIVLFTSLAIIIPLCILPIHKHYNQPIRKLRRRFSR